LTHSQIETSCLAHVGERPAAVFQHNTGMDAFRVFISSIMNTAIEDLGAERVAARTAIERFAPITVAWAFEAEPASPKPLLEFYIGAAKECDLFLLILGEYATNPVRDEVQVACDYRKAMLVFCKDVADRQPEAHGLLRSFDLKYDRFTDAMDLHGKIRVALGYHLLHLIRREEPSNNRLGDRLARLREFKRSRREVRIIPTVPVCRHNSFTVEEVTTTYVTLQKGGLANVHVPVERVVEVLETGAHEPPTVQLAGRLQLVTPKQNWYFFPEPPPSSDLLGIGVGRTVPRDFSFSEETTRLLQTYPHEVCWSNPENVPDREVFYDVDGRYLTNGRQILTCTRVSTI
jgi:Domain of unknown function (DUF4062)